MTNRIIMDTDIGSDIDDALALALAMRSKELVIEGITTVYGDVALRAKLAKKLLQLGGREDVKVFAGINQPLLHNRDIWMAGHEGEGEYDHRPTGQTVALPDISGNVEVCLEVDSQRFSKVLLERLLGV